MGRTVPQLTAFILTSVATHWSLEAIGSYWRELQMPFPPPNQVHQVCKETQVYIVCLNVSLQLHAFHHNSVF